MMKDEKGGKEWAKKDKRECDNVFFMLSEHFLKRINRIVGKN